MKNRMQEKMLIGEVHRQLCKPSEERSDGGIQMPKRGLLVHDTGIELFRPPRVTEESGFLWHIVTAERIVRRTKEATSFLI